MIVWPFTERDDGPNPGRDGSGQWRRIDQGQDLQARVGIGLVAIADGVISYAHDPAGFGDSYPVLTFRSPIDGNPAAYYGHNRCTLPSGTSVAQGDVIGHTLAAPGGNASGLPGWLELGWWNGGPTGDGRSMHDHLLTAPVHGDDMPLNDADKTFIDQTVAKWVNAREDVTDRKIDALQAEVDRIARKVGA